jgi:hypothetical protein
VIRLEDNFGLTWPIVVLLGLASGKTPRETQGNSES